MKGYLVDTCTRRLASRTWCKQFKALFYDIQYMRSDGSSQPTCMEIIFFIKKYSFS